MGSKLFRCIINGQEYNIQVESTRSGIMLTYMGTDIEASIHTPRAAELAKFMINRGDNNINPDLVANIAGMVSSIKVSEGESVTKGQPLAVLEAMKMENVLFSHIDGIVKKVMVKKGDNVSVDQILIVINDCV